jgi:hypothetical protein
MHRDGGIIIMLEIYHGSSIEIRGPKIIEVGFNKDFGNGFYYCTPEFIYESYKAGEMLD